VNPAVLPDRIQFAFTLMFHYLFPIGTMGLAPFIAWFTIKGVSSGDRVALAAGRFLAKIFALNFAIGVVSGIPMEFQFGTNFAAFSTLAGSVVGQPLALEGIYAFFFESIFLGIFLYGRNRVSPTLYAFSAAALWAGSWLSGFFIISTNAWMQHPVGFRIATDGRIELTSLWALLLSPFAWWEYAHVMTGALVAGAFVVAGIGAYYLLGRRQIEFGRRFVRSGILVGVVASLIAIFPTGDANGDNVTHDQPAKLAAMEGLFKTQQGAPLAIVGMPDTQHAMLIDPIYVPDLLSYLAYGNFRASVRGISAYPAAMRPPVELTYYAYHVMVGLGTIFAAITVAGVLMLVTRRLFEARWMLWILMLAMPFPYIANEAGWVVTEVGRQPWIVYGLLRTSAAASPTVVAGETIFTTLGFAGIYFVLGVLFVLLVLREIAVGPTEQGT
jgi:cytochrome bd ubiquinol oxidase subunit I